LLSALSAALVTIFGKLGLKGIDSTLATTIRGVIMALFLLCVSIAFKKFNGFSLDSFSGREWLFIVLAGIAGALSWLFYFFALKNGPATGTVAIDRTSIVFVVILAALFLGESMGWKAIIGMMLIVGGALLLSL